jgi:hypothetical protein
MRRRVLALLLILLLPAVLAACTEEKSSEAQITFEPALPAWATDSDVEIEFVGSQGTTCGLANISSTTATVVAGEADLSGCSTPSGARFNLVLYRSEATSSNSSKPWLIRSWPLAVLSESATSTREQTSGTTKYIITSARFTLDASDMPAGKPLRGTNPQGPTPTPAPEATPTPEPTAEPTAEPTVAPTATPTPLPLVFNTYPNVTVNATSADGAVVTADLTAFVLNGGPNLAVTCVPASGSTFPIGTTNVACVAQDGARSAQSAFTVTVVDGAPVMDPWAISLAGIAASYADGSPRVTYEAPTATDAVDGTATVTCTPASGTGEFAFGRNTITCQATDSKGQQSDPATFSFGLESPLAAPVSPAGCPAQGAGTSQPPIPMFLSGSVVLNGAPAPDGTQVFVLLKNLAAGEGLTECWTTTAQVKLTSGGAFSSLLVSPPDSSAGWFPAKFYVNGYLATTDYEITSGTFRGGTSVPGITLTASSIPATVTVVP